MLYKEIAIYCLVGFSSLSMLAYTVHMFIGGMVSEQTERTVMVAAVLIGLVVLAFLGRNIVRRRRAYQEYLQKTGQEDG